jgi:hypothetical protein
MFDDEFAGFRIICIDEESALPPDCPERELLRAILRVTLLDLSGKGSESRKARCYVESSDESHPLTFQNLCYMLDLNPERVRRLAGIRDG